MSFITEKLPICVCGEPYVKQFTLDVKVLSDGIAIAKVLAMPATACVTGVRVADGEASVDGALSVRLLYIDGEGARKVARAESDFAERIKVCSEQTYALASVSVIDVEATRVATDSVALKCVLELKLNTVEQKLAPAVTQTEDGIFTQSGVLSATAFVGEAQAKLVEQGEKELADAEGDVLLVESVASVSGVSARSDCFLLDVNIVTDVLYRGMDGQLKRVSFTTPVSNEVALKGLTAQALVTCVASICDVKHELQAREGGAPALHCAWTVNAFAYAVNPVSYPVLTDAFSATHELSIEKQKVCACSMAQESVSRRVDGSATLDAELPACDSVLAIAGVRCSVANVYVASGKLVAEGILSCSVLYLNKEYGTTNSVSVEIPYSTPIADGNAQCVYTVGATVLSAQASLLRVGSIDVAAEVAFAVTACECACVECVSGLSVGAERKVDGSGLTVYVARKDESLWDIAKALCVTPDAVLKLNADVTFPTAEGQKIILYRQLS